MYSAIYKSNITYLMLYDAWLAQNKDTVFEGP